MSLPSPTLSYSSLPRKRPYALYWLRAAYFCGAAPLLTGTIIVGLWLFTYHRMLAVLGLFTVAGGVVLLLLGLICVLVYEMLSARGPKKPRRWSRSSWPVLLLLLANIPACILSIYIGSAWRITVVNSTAATIDSFTIDQGTGSLRTLGPIAPGGRKTVYIRPVEDVTITFSATSSSGPLTGVVDGYPIGPEGDSKVITLLPNGTSSVQ